MKKTTIILGLFITTNIKAQDNDISLKDLAVPNSPAFILTDIVPSLAQTPNTPKAFALGLAQTFQQGSGVGFPQNYSAEFSPYWWFDPNDRTIFSLVGLKGSAAAGYKENPLSGLKFSSFSIAFLNKDLIPDTIMLSQRVFSLGFRATVVKIHLKNYASDLQTKIAEWHTAAQSEMDANSDLLAEISRHPERTAELYARFKPQSTHKITEEINDIINEKPIFSLEFAGAFASYGLYDTIWKLGKSGVWTNMSSHIPLAINDNKPNKNYLNINVSVRYLYDSYFKNENNLLSTNASFDLGGKMALEFNQFSVGVESLYRYNNGYPHPQNRTVGLINYKISDNLYLNGAFGKNFGLPDKLVALFGVSWGFGTESVKLD